MARRSSGNTNKCVEEKRRQLPIYQHYTLSPGKTKSHHPEAKCIHCLKEFVCGSKQRLIRHIRKCNSISNADQIVAETLNTLARNSATGQLNNSILEASNLLPSQISHIQHSATQQLVGQAINQNSTTVTTTNNGGNNINHNTSGTTLNTNDSLVVTTSPLNEAVLAMKKPSKRGRKPGSHGSMGPAIHVTTGMDGKTHFTPASQLPHGIVQSSSHMISPAHDGRAGQVGYAYQTVVASTASPATSITASGAHINTTNSGHMTCATSNHHSSPYKLNTELIVKAYLKLVLTRNLPFSLCNTKEFHAWIKTFANDYKPPSSINLIAQNLKQEAHSARQRVSNILVKTSKKTINLELHCLPDEIRGHLWYTMIAGVDHRRFMISVRDILGRINHRSQGLVADSIPEKILNEFIDDCVKRVGSDRVNSLILTGKSDTDSIVARARRSLYLSHPSIVTYNCWWHFTNLLCSDVIEHDELFVDVVKNSNLLINFINKRPSLSSNVEKFSPFIGAPGTIHRKRNDNRWYSHLVCYLLEYIKNNNEAIHKTLEEYISAKLFSDNNNNDDDSLATGNAHPNSQQNSNLGTQQTTHMFRREDPQLIRVKSLVMSDDYWANLSTALEFLKSFRDIVALAQHMPSVQNINGRSNSGDQVTLAISPITCNNLSLSDYMNWLLKYGRSLIEGWRISPNSNKHQLVGRFLQRFNESIDDFKLLFAAYLLNPKHRCAYMTQRAKNLAIEEILNVASEFMPEESDGHTIFDQWKLYLVREQPYDMIFDDNRSTPLEWWMSLPCAESIRRVAIRILRLRAFSSPKPETLFSQLYFYEDETKTNLTESVFEDVAILRYFYDHEDKIGHPGTHSSSHNYTDSTFNHANNPLVSNGYCDRTQVGQIHNDYFQEASNPEKLVPTGSLDTADSNGKYDNTTAISENVSESYSHVVESYMNSNSHLNLDDHSNLNNSVNMTLENLPGYDQFSIYVDYNDSGIQIVEEPIEKKRRKWTAQEILSKVQPNHHGNNNDHDIDRK